jgi:hypothetical protein
MSVTATSAEIGPFVTGADVEAAIISTLKDWLPSYLAEGERKHGLTAGDIARPKGWAITGRELNKFTSDQLPVIVVMAGGILVKPLVHGSPGSTTAVWQVDVGCIFNAAWNDKARQHAQLYVRAIGLTLLQRPLEGLVCVVDQVGENYDELDFSESRTYSGARGRFTVEVEDTMWRSGGPPPYVTPPTDPDAPLDPWTQVTGTDVEVDNTPPPTPLS